MPGGECGLRSSDEGYSFVVRIASTLFYCDRLHVSACPVLPLGHHDCSPMSSDTSNEEFMKAFARRFHAWRCRGDTHAKRGRRRLFLRAIAIPALRSLSSIVGWPVAALAAPSFLGRVRPGHKAWPSAARWQALNESVGGRLIGVESPLQACTASASGVDCAALFKELKNPFFIGDRQA